MALSAFGALLGHAERLARLPFLDDFEDVRNHFAGALDKHGVADVQAQPLDLVHVVERGAADGDAANLDGLEHGHGRKRSGAAHLDDDVVDHRGFLARGIFVGDGPARGFRREAEFVLHARGIHLDDDAIDFVRKFFALCVPGVAIGRSLLRSRRRVSNRRRRGIASASAPARESECLAKWDFAIDEKVVGEKIQPPDGGYGGIEHADGSCSGVARIDEDFAARLFLLPIQLFKRLARHHDFAAHFKIWGEASLF